MKINLREPQFCYEIGKRNNNEDRIYPAPSTATSANRLFLVCDGMGGHNDGEVASKTVTEAIADYWNIHNDESDTAQKVMNAIEAAIAQMDQLVNNSQGDKRMGTTLTLAAINADAVLVAHVGDSRIYQIRPNTGIIYQSKDHSLVQTWVDAGIITQEEARNHPKSNIITQVIQPGSFELIAPEIVTLKDVKDGDYLFLCSDGIIESISDDELVSILSSDISNNEKMEQIKQICSEHSRDNYSAYLIELKISS
jgi:protein phosphatase